MKPAFDPDRLDVAAFARAGGTLSGALTLSDLSRLAEGTTPPADEPPGQAPWTATGHCRHPAGRPEEIRLHLTASATVWLTCQRCLQPMREALVVDRTVRFVPGEDDAARLDEEGEEDVLALPRRLRLTELVEDELILALPLVPRHAVCQPPRDLTEPDPAAAGPEPSPFAALAGLKGAPKAGR